MRLRPYILDEGGFVHRPISFSLYSSSLSSDPTCPILRTGVWEREIPFRLACEARRLHLIPRLELVDLVNAAWEILSFTGAFDLDVHRAGGDPTSGGAGSASRLILQYS